MLSSKTTNFAEKGTVSVGWTAMKTETDNVFKQHAQVSSQMQTNVIAPLLTLKKEQSSNRATLGAEVTKLDKGLERGKSELSKAKSKYFRLCRDHEINTANLQKAEKDPTTMKPKELIRLRTTVQTLKKDSEAAHIQYQQQIKDFQAYQKKYEEGLKKILQDFQAMEEKRIQKLKEVEEKMLQSLDSLVSSLQQSTQAYRKSIEQMDYMADVQGFIQQNKTGAIPEAPVEYEPYISQLTGQPAHQADKTVTFSSPTPKKTKKGQKKNKLGKKKVKKDKDKDKDKEDGASITVTPVSQTPPPVSTRDPRSGSEGTVNLVITQKPAGNAEPIAEPHEGVAALDKKEESRDKTIVKAKALYDYPAADDTEISFKVDDIITVTRNDDSIPGWMEGEVNGKRGLFPGNYVEILNRNRKCVVLYDFSAENDDELTIKEGEELIIESETEGWFTGTNKDGKTGLFPANYVEER